MGELHLLNPTKYYDTFCYLKHLYLQSLLADFAFERCGVGFVLLSALDARLAGGPPAGPGKGVIAVAFQLRGPLVELGALDVEFARQR